MYRSHSGSLTILFLYLVVPLIIPSSVMVSTNLLLLILLKHLRSMLFTPTLLSFGHDTMGTPFGRP